MSVELTVNRAGRMTIGQRFKLLRGVAALLLLSALGLIVSLAIGPNLLEAFQQDLILGVLATVFFLVCLAMGLGCAVGAAAVLADTVLGRVRSATGVARLKREDVTTYAVARPLAIPVAYPGAYKYRMEVAGHEFSMGREAGDLLLRHRGGVRVYYAAYCGELLTIEPLSGGGVGDQDGTAASDREGAQGSEH